MFDSKKYLKEYKIKYPERFKKYNKRGKKEFIRYRKQLIYELKSNGCSICGYNKHPNILDFHHVNPKDKKFRLCISIIGHNHSYNDIFNEFEKCILLCANCHREIENGVI